MTYGSILDFGMRPALVRLERLMQLTSRSIIVMHGLNLDVQTVWARDFGFKVFCLFYLWNERSANTRVGRQKEVGSRGKSEVGMRKWEKKKVRG